jgi:hypothetical protein
MLPRERRKFIPHANFPRRRKRDEFIKLRWKIRCDASQYGGLFTSHQLLNEPGRPAFYNQWLDFYFLGLDGLTIWNATIITAHRAFWDEVDHLSWEQTAALMTEEELTAEFRMTHKPVIGPKGKKYYTLSFSEKRPYEQFRGLTFNQYKEQIEQNIVQHSPPMIYESFLQDPGYQYGVGLQMVVDTEEINQTSVEAAINRFYQLKEPNWRNDTPVPRERLPYVTEQEAWAKMKPE